MKILLVSLNNYAFNRGLLYFPLSLYYLRGYALSQNLLAGQVSTNIRIFNSSLSNREILTSIMAEKSQIVGFSCWCWNIKQILEVSHLLKKVDPSVKIVLGGPQVSPVKEGQSILKSNNVIDIIVHGEGEVTFSELVQFYLTGKPDLRNIEGISFREGELMIRSTPPRKPLADLDRIPLEISSEDVRSSDLDKTLFLLETQRGCPFKCRFCNYNKGFKGVRFFSLQRVKDNIKFLLDNGAKRLYLADPTFNTNLKRAKEILRFIIDQKKDLILNTEIKAELMDEEFARLLKLAGTRFLDVGLQSINPQALEAMNRNLNQERFEKGIKLLRNEKIGFQIQLISGLPGDNYDGFCSSINYAMNLIDNNWGMIEVFPLELIPGSEFHGKSSEFGIIFEESPPNYVIQTDTFSLKDMEKVENLIASLKGIYSSRLLRSLANSLPHKPTMIAVNWSDWLSKNLRISLDRYNDMGPFSRVRIFKKFIKDGYSESGFKKYIHSFKHNLILAREIYRSFFWA